MTRATRGLAWIVVTAALVCVLAYLRDPPWVGGITSGLQGWAEDGAGGRYRWTNGHASFYVPRDVGRVTLPVRSGVPRPDGAPVTVSVSVDGHWFASRQLDDPERWVDITFRTPPRPHGRRFRRVEIRVDGVIRGQNLGVQLGEPVLTSRDRP